MKANSFEYISGNEFKSILKNLHESSVYSKFLAGSQSIGPMLNLRLTQPEQLIDIKGVLELKEARIKNTYLEMGACITHANIEDELIPDVTNGMMQYVAKNIAYRAIRNQGTIGGSLCHADPAADWITTMTLLDAQLELIRLDANTEKIETRTVPMAKFMTGPFTTVIHDDEMLSKICIPIYSKNVKWGYYKICQKPGEFSQATAAVLSDDEKKIYRLVVGATQSTPLLLTDAKQTLDGYKTEDLSRWLKESLAADEFEIQRYKVAVQRAIEMLHMKD